MYSTCTFVHVRMSVFKNALQSAAPFINVCHLQEYNMFERFQQCIVLHATILLKCLSIRSASHCVVWYKPEACCQRLIPHPTMESQATGRGPSNACSPKRVTKQTRYHCRARPTYRFLKKKSLKICDSLDWCAEAAEPVPLQGFYIAS